MSGVSMQAARSRPVRPIHPVSGAPPQPTVVADGGWGNGTNHGGAGQAEEGCLLRLCAPRSVFTGKQGVWGGRQKVSVSPSVHLESALGRQMWERV